MEKREITAKMTLREKVDFLTGSAMFRTLSLPHLGVRSLALSDGPHGLRKETSKELKKHKSFPSTCFPTASLMACSWDETLGRRIGEALGKEAAALGVDVLLGPGLNIKRDPRCGRNFEYFSEDPLLAGKMAAAYVRGIQSENVNACIKHFAANNREYRRMVSDSLVDERTLREIYLSGFEIAVKEGGANAVMTSYNRINGTYANENVHLLREVLRGEWGFEGVVLSDWAGCNSRVEALKAGSDLEMPLCKYGADDLYAAVRAGEIDETLLDESISRILGLIGFSDKKAKVSANGREQDNREWRILLEEDHALARECAAKSIVLLENDGVLPLAKGTEIALIGACAFMPDFQGAGSSAVDPAYLDTAEHILEERGELPKDRKSRGYDPFGRKRRKLFRQALRCAKKADVILFFAAASPEAEGVDRPDMQIPSNQKELFSALLATGKKVVAVLSSGSAVETGWLNGAAAVVYAGLSGQAGAGAIIDVLYGDVVPSGKLAESWADEENYATFPKTLFPCGRDNVEYREGIFVGYRYFTTAGIKPKYPFGYGKSYTSFEYSDITADIEGVSFIVKNTGKVGGDEIAQVYVAKEGSRIVRPLRELRGFARVSLLPGESKRVSLKFGPRTFAYYEASAGEWQIEAGKYRIEIGASSEDIRLTAEIETSGAVAADEKLKYPVYAACDVRQIPDAEFYDRLGFVPENEKPLGRRITVGENTTAEDLARAKGFTGRLFSWLFCRVLLRFSRLIHNRSLENTILMGVMHQPVRGLAQFGGFTRARMEGLINMFNGSFFKGLRGILKKQRSVAESSAGKGEDQ